MDWSEFARILISFVLGLAGALLVEKWVAADRRGRLANAARDMIATAALSNLRTIWLMDDAVSATLGHGQLAARATFAIDPFIFRQLTTAEIIGVLSPIETTLMGQVLQDLTTTQDSNQAFYRAHENAVKDPLLTPLRDHAHRYWSIYRRVAMANLMNLLMTSVHRQKGPPTGGHARTLVGATKPQRNLWRKREISSDHGKLLMGLRSSDLRSREPAELGKAKWALCWEHDWIECPVPTVGVHNLLFPDDATFMKNSDSA